MTAAAKYQLLLTESFRPHIILRDGISICGIALTEQEELSPGASGKAAVMVLQPERISSFEMGDSFWLLESGYIIGEGKIEEFLAEPHEINGNLAN